MRCAQLGIRRDRVLQRFDEWAEGATKFQRMDQYSAAKEIPDVRARIKANDCLADIMGCYEESADENTSRSSAHTVCVVVTDDRAAARLARLLSPGGAAGVVIDVDAQVEASTWSIRLTCIGSIGQPGWPATRIPGGPMHSSGCASTA